jgi:uncharacterized damage-inducible protein DinB
VFFRGNSFLKKEMKKQIIENYLSDAIQSFRNYKNLAEKAMVQVSDEEFFRLIDQESNSIAIIVKHIAGNLKSRWTDFLTSDGEKDFRQRDSEFIVENETRESLMNFWKESWQVLFEALESLTAKDFEKKITIRQQSHTICEAINRQLTHYAYHIGQITFLAKHFRSTDWKTLSVPKNKSKEFNVFMNENKGDKRKQVELAEEFEKKK